MKKVLSISVLSVFFLATDVLAQTHYYHRPSPKDAILARRETPVEVATVTTAYPVVVVSKPLFAWHWKIKGCKKQRKR